MEMFMEDPRKKEIFDKLCALSENMQGIGNFWGYKFIYFDLIYILI